MSGAFNPAQAITEQNVAGRGWWAVTGNGLAAGPFPDGISAAAYSHKVHWNGSPGISECYYNYNSDGIATIATCRGYTTGGALRGGNSTLHCNTGEFYSESGGGCVAPPTSNKKVCMNDTGNPVDLVNGNKHQAVTDFSTQGPQLFGLTRAYNSQIAYYANKFSSGRFGKGWRTQYDAAAKYKGAAAAPSHIYIILPDGREAVFRAVSGVMQPAYWNKTTNSWTAPRRDVDESVTLIGGAIWRYVGPDDTAYDFNLTGQLVQIRTRTGYAKTLSYNAAGKNIGVSDNLGRAIAFTYNSAGLADTLTGPDGKVYRYIYKSILAAVPDVVLPPVPNHPEWALEKVIYPDATPGTDADNPSQTYHYENANFPWALTGVTDEKGVRFATWAYDAAGRAISSQHAGGAEATSITYNDVANTRTVTNPLGKQAIYQLETFQDQLRIKQIAGQPSANCVAADTVFVYDANGYISQETDGKGNVTKYVRNARGQETSRTEAFGTPQARIITTSWHATFRLPLQITVPGLTTAFSYESDGLLTGRTQTDTTSHTAPYSSNGQSRAWSFSYTIPGLLDIVDGPLPGAGDSINYDYNANGFLSQVTNEAGHVTQITSVNGRGQPLSVTDPNGVVSTLAYDARGWLTSVTVDPGSAQAVTAIAYDAISQITRITRPDGSFLDYAYDDARRLISISNASNEKITYAYDAMGNRTRTDVLSAANAITATQSQTYDELGRLLRELGAGAQTTTHAYDKADNRTATTDPRSKLYGFAFDALNRLVSETDPALAQIAYTQDAADNLGAVTDARGLATVYVHNGWGEVIRETSPDRGITDYVRDARGLVTQQTDARLVISSFTYDSLGRMLTRSYAATPADNVQYFHDDITGGNRGIGRLTKITDKSGETAFTYDPRGNAVREARVIAGQAYATLFTYDAADQLTSLTYPSGRIVTYVRDASGRVISVSAKINAAATPVTVASGITHAPFGPLTGLSFGNGIVLSQTYDQDYRLSTLAATGVQNLTYSHDPAGNISAIADAITPTRNQSFAYDDLNRLTAANGVYGAYGYAYDLSGNRIAQSRPAANDAYSIALSSNRLTQITGSVTRSFTYDAAGHAANDNRGPGADYSYTYDAAGGMAQADRDGLTLARYTSDARHLRVIRDLPGAGVPKTHFIYDASGNLLAEHDGVSGAVLREVIWLPPQEQTSSALPLAWVDAAASGAPLYTVHADHLGTPQKLTDQAGAIAWDGVFAPFGETHAITGTLAQNLRFPGQYADSESGLSYNWHRHYDPVLGRYLQSDPIGLAGGINTYAYVDGNPLRWIDPWGLFQFGTRGLDGFGGLDFGNPSRTNRGLFHEQGFYEDGSGDNVGFFEDGQVKADPNYPSNRDLYEMFGPHYDDNLMRKAQDMVDSGEYDLLTNNCQHYADKLRSAYNKLKANGARSMLGLPQK